MNTQTRKPEHLETNTGEFLSEHSFEEIHEMLDKLYSGWALSSAEEVERDERLRTLIFFDELKQFFEKIEASN